VTTSGDLVDVAVSDHGPGVPAAELASIFERTWRGDDEDNERRGLGLAIARQVAEAHGGKLVVESPGPGGYSTTFTLSIPVG
jgi:two-component system OmpR family sensor kinase